MKRIRRITANKKGVLTFTLFAFLITGLIVAASLNLASSPNEAEAQVRPTPTPDPALISSQPRDLIAESEAQLRAAVDRMPASRKRWIDKDTVVYLGQYDPHDPSKGWIVIVQHFPTVTSITYDKAGVEIGRFIGPTRLVKHPQGAQIAEQLASDPEVQAAVSDLRRSVQ